MRIYIKDLDEDTQDILVVEAIKKHWDNGLGYNYKDFDEVMRDERLKDKILQDLLMKSIEITDDLEY